MAHLGAHFVATPRLTALGAARAALVVGAAFAGVSIYWGLGGTAGLDTIGGRLAEGGRSGTVATTSMVWAAAVLKMVASVLPILLVSSRVRSFHPRWWPRGLRWLVRIEAVILTGYGAVLCLVGILVQLGVIPTPPTADHYALAWHTWLWDPWFLLWGLLVTATLVRSRPAWPTTTRPPDSSPAPDSAPC